MPPSLWRKRLLQDRLGGISAFLDPKLAQKAGCRSDMLSNVFQQFLRFANLSADAFPKGRAHNHSD